MSNKVNQAVVQPSVVGAFTGALTAAASAITNGCKMVDNAFVAGERITYIAASKASNLAEISDTADTLKLVVAKKELADEIERLGVTVNQDGSMSF